MEQSKLGQYSERLMEIPQQLYDLQDELFTYSNKNQEISNAISEAEGALKLEIANELDPETGKKKYSNADARSAAFIESSKSDERLKSLNLELNVVKIKLHTLKLDIDCISNEQRNIRSILGFFSNNQ